MYHGLPFQCLANPLTEAQSVRFIKTKKHVEKGLDPSEQVGKGQFCTKPNFTVGYNIGE